MGNKEAVLLFVMECVGNIERKLVFIFTAPALLDSKYCLLCLLRWWRRMTDFTLHKVGYIRDWNVMMRRERW